jgi:hypothetical protein
MRPHQELSVAGLLLVHKKVLSGLNSRTKSDAIASLFVRR